MAPRTFQGQGYRALQAANTQARAQLTAAQRRDLKAKKLSNVGWDNVIALYHALQKLGVLQPSPASSEVTPYDDFSLEDLFLEADRIGNKYQTAAEVTAFQETLAQKAQEIADEVDRQFPDTQTEILDFRDSATKPAARKTATRTSRSVIKGSQSSPAQSSPAQSSPTKPSPTRKSSPSKRRKP